VTTGGYGIALKETSDFSIAIKINDLPGQFRDITTQLLNFKTCDKSCRPLLYVGCNESFAEKYDLVENALINNIFKYRFREDLYFLRVPPDNGRKLWFESSIQQILLAVSFVIQNEIMPRGGLPAHSLLLEYKNKGILLVGGSGTGKTTASKRVRLPWKALSDDQAFIVKKKGAFRAHPFVTISECLDIGLPVPRDLNYSIPLTSIFFLNRSDRDRVTGINRAKAVYEFYNAAVLLVKFYYKNFSTSPELKYLRTIIFSNACDIIQSIPSYKLEASLTGRFWETIQEVVDCDT